MSFMQTKDAPSMALLVLHLFGPRGTLESRKKWLPCHFLLTGF